METLCCLTLLLHFSCQSILLPSVATISHFSWCPLFFFYWERKIKLRRTSVYFLDQIYSYPHNMWTHQVYLLSSCDKISLVMYFDSHIVLDVLLHFSASPPLRRKCWYSLSSLFSSYYLSNSLQSALCFRLSFGTAIANVYQRPAHHHSLSHHCPHLLRNFWHSGTYSPPWVTFFAWDFPLNFSIFHLVPCPLLPSLLYFNFLYLSIKLGYAQGAILKLYLFCIYTVPFGGFTKDCDFKSTISILMTQIHMLNRDFSPVITYFHM